MDPTILSELLKQFGWTSVAIALVVSFLMITSINLGIFFINQKIQQQREEKLEQTRTNLEKELAAFKASEIREIENVYQAKWELKYRACLDALEIVDIFLSQYYEEVDGITPVRQPADTIKACECQNRLALTCKDPKVTEAFLRILFPSPQATMIEIIDNLHEFRNFIRKELGFVKRIKLSTNTAWFVRFAGDNRDNL